MNQQPDYRVLAEGRFARLVAQNGWEWVERTNTSGAAVIVPITEDRQIVLVEQYRIPLRCRVVELPAGLVGDTLGNEDEALAEAAHRELLEETGYQAESMDALVAGPSTAGLANEIYSMFLARNARRVGSGGGDGTEAIHVHVVALRDVDAWLEQKRQEGVQVDPRVYAGLYFVHVAGL